MKVLIAGLILATTAGGALLTYRIIFIKAVRVPTGAMANTIIPGDHLVVHKLRDNVNRGDIVVFRYPDEPTVQYISRVVGLPGERIQTRGYFVYVNGQPIPEQRVLVPQSDGPVAGPMKELTTEGVGPYRVFYIKRDGEESLINDYNTDARYGVAEEFNTPANHYFLLGDNRDNSFDSRFRGPVPRGLIWGKASTIYWSISDPEGNVNWNRIGKSVR